jgi:hypothetical protein
MDDVAKEQDAIAEAGEALVEPLRFANFKFW